MLSSEWYSWHFPELARIVSEHGLYAKLAAFIRNRNTLTTDSLEPLTEIVQDSNKAKQILDASRTSMGKYQRATRTLSLPCHSLT